MYLQNWMDKLPTELETHGDKIIRNAKIINTCKNSDFVKRNFIKWTKGIWQHLCNNYFKVSVECMLIMVSVIKKWQDFIALTPLSKGWLNIYDIVCLRELSMTQEGDSIKYPTQLMGITLIISLGGFELLNCGFFFF